MARRRHLLVQLSIFVLLLVNLELVFTVVLRVQGLDTEHAIAQHDPHTGWSMRQNFAQGTVDGFRNPFVPQEKPPGELRLLCLGGSVTYGTGVAEPGDAYPLLLEQLLDAGGRKPPARVLNGGVPAFASHQFLSRLVEDAPRYKPDIVTVMCGFNEHYADGYRRLEPEAADLIFRSHPYRDATSSILYRSATYRWLLYQIGSSRPVSPPDALVIKGEDLSAVTAETQVLTNSVDNVTIMARFARSRGMRMLLIHEGHRLDVPEGLDGINLVIYGTRKMKKADYLEFLDHVRCAHQEAARRLDIPFLEINPGLKASGYSEDQMFQPRDPLHLTKLGNQVAASVIHQKLQQLGWLDPR